MKQDWLLAPTMSPTLIPLLLVLMLAPGEAGEAACSAQQMQARA